MLNVFDTSGVRSRHFAMPLEAYSDVATFSQRNEKFIECARVLNVEASRKALDRAGLCAEDVTHVVLVTSTGIATPSLDARLINDLPLPGSVRRVPVWGLGCGGGGAALGLAADLARSSPEAVVLVVVVELCSLAFVPGTRTKLNLVASALFGDGAAAAIVTGAGSGLELTAHRTTTWPDTLGMMGWNVGDEGLGLVLSRNLPAFARERMPDVMEDLRAAVGLVLRRDARLRRPPPRRAEGPRGPGRGDGPPRSPARSRAARARAAREHVGADVPLRARGDPPGDARARRGPASTR